MNYTNVMTEYEIMRAIEVNKYILTDSRLAKALGITIDQIVIRRRQMRKSKIFFTHTDTVDSDVQKEIMALYEFQSSYSGTMADSLKHRIEFLKSKL